jgi:2'-5' RNA ligase
MVHPRALWVGLKDTKQKLNRMATSLEKALQKMGFEKDQRTFHPHITIGRVRSSKNISDLSRSMPDCHASGNLTQTISGITLFKSTLNQDGPTYEPLYQVKFMN